MMTATTIKMIFTTGLACLAAGAGAYTAGTGTGPELGAAAPCIGGMGFGGMGFGGTGVGEDGNAGAEG
jgi:hypothetical protein